VLADDQRRRRLRDGAGALLGKLPVQLSGSLVSKDHPVGATGLSMIHELALHRRREAGDARRSARGIAREVFHQPSVAFIQQRNDCPMLPPDLNNSGWGRSRPKACFR
jgi:hypothetical protein